MAGPSPATVASWSAGRACCPPTGCNEGKEGTATEGDPPHAGKRGHAAQEADQGQRREQTEAQGSAGTQKRGPGHRRCSRQSSSACDVCSRLLVDGKAGARICPGCFCHGCRAPREISWSGTPITCGCRDTVLGVIPTLTGAPTTKMAVRQEGTPAPPMEDVMLYRESPEGKAARGRANLEMDRDRQEEHSELREVEEAARKAAARARRAGGGPVQQPASEAAAANRRDAEAQRLRQRRLQGARKGAQAEAEDEAEDEDEEEGPPD